MFRPRPTAWSRPLLRDRESISIPEFILDLSALGALPAHLPRSLSSLEFPHRNADAYLRDAVLGDERFIRTKIGEAIFGATAQECGPLMSWFPQALLYGFWQSHLGKKRHNSKHARAWVSEIIGWQPASTETRVLGVKGDPLNLNTDDPVTSNPDDLTMWDIGGAEKVEGGRSPALSSTPRRDTGRPAADPGGLYRSFNFSCFPLISDYTSSR